MSSTPTTSTETANPVGLTAAEVETLTCDCDASHDEKHGVNCGTRGEYAVLVPGSVLVARVETILAARLATQGEVA